MDTAITKNMPEFPRELIDFVISGFNLKEHLESFLALDSDTLNSRLETSLADMALLSRHEFDWTKATEFYRDKVHEAYLLELSAWHLSSRDYIGATLRLIADFAKGVVLDFGGGIGTHTIAAACCDQVETVVFCDLNPVNREFIKYRIEQLGLSQKVSFCEQIPADMPASSFNTILAFDVLEHLPDPVNQITQFYQWLAPEGVAILNWYFFKGFKGEYPFHLDNPIIISEFFRKLQKYFLEIFHPYYISTRCYTRLV